MSLRNALAHLTSLRIPPRTRVPLIHSLHYFPWVGAAHGSLNVMGFIAASHFLPMPIACLFAVVLPQALAGFGPWRGVLEAAQGRRTHPGHLFTAGFRPDLKGLSMVAGLAAVQWFSLMMLTPDWRVRAALVFPIMGMSAHTWAFLQTARSQEKPGTLLARRRVRAGFLSALLLFLVFLFPARAALCILVAGAFTAWLTLRLRHPRRAPAPQRDLTLQTAGMVTAFTETAVLAGLVVAGLILFQDVGPNLN